MKQWSDYVDNLGLVTQKSGDGGDSLNRTCAVAILKELTGVAIPETDILGIATMLKSEDNKYRRSYHAGMWYSNYDRTSRDQLTPLLILFGLINAKKLLKGILLDHLKRFLLFTYNTRRNHVYPTREEHLKKSTPDVKWNYGWKLPDPTGPEFLALYIRGLQIRFLFPLLVCLDLHTLIGSYVIRRNKQDDVVNHALILEYAKVRMDTWAMRKAREITPRTLLQERLDNFFGPEREPPINQLYRLLPK